MSLSAVLQQITTSSSAMAERPCDAGGNVSSRQF